MGIVKYTGPIASFHCPTNAEIRSLKVHFSPKQEGEGTPSPENVRPIVGWDGVEVYDYTKTDVNTAIIPSEYQKVEYLQGNSGPYINPNQLLYKGDVVNLKFKYDVVHENDVQWGYRYYGTYTGRWQNYINSNYTKDLKNRLIIAGVPASTSGVGSNNCFEVGVINNICLDTESEQIIVNGVNSSINFNFSESYAFASTGDSYYPPYLFAINNCGTAGGMCSQSTKVYDYRVTRQGTDIIHLIPCLRKSDNKPGMYDTVSKTFYTNAGTGEFLYGPEISGYTTNYEFGVLGKNKLDVSSFIDGEHIKSDGSISQNSEFRRTDYLHLTSGSYIYSATKTDGITAYVRVCGYDKNKAFVAQLGEQVKGSGNYEMAFTVPENVHYIILQSYKANTNEQIELGSTATTYEPYDPKHTVYGGWVDLISGEVQQEWTEPLTLGEPYYYGGNVCFNYTYPSKYTDYSSSMPVDRVFSVFAKSDFSINPSNHFIFGGNSAFVKTDGNGNLNPEWTEWYDSLETKPTISLKLFEPITYQLVSTQLQTFLSTNNIWSNADYVEVEYDLYETQDILARKQFIIANQPHIIKPAAAPIQTFTTDLVAPLKECKIHFSPVQGGTGDPSPDNVRAISGWTGVEVYRSGKNMWGGEALKTALVNIMPVTSVNNNIVTYSNANAAQHDGDILFDKFKENTQYTLFLTYSKDTNKYSHIKFVYSDGSFENMNILNLTANTKSTGIFVSKANKSLTKITRSADEYSTVTMYCDECGLFEGVLTASDYEPYTGTTLPINWTTEAGTVYGGYVDLIKGEVVQTHYSIMLDGTNVAANSGYVDSTRYGGGFVYMKNYGFPNGVVSYTYKHIYCDKLPVREYGVTRQKELFFAYAGSLYFVVFMGEKDSSTSITKTEAKNACNDWLQENPLHVVYELETPIVHILDPITLKTLRGTNNIWASNNGGNIEVSFWRH